MTTIRLVTFCEAPNCWDITDADLDREIDVQLSEYVSQNIDDIDSPGFEIEDFDVPDNLMMQDNRSFINDICQGKSFGIWSGNVDFNDEYYQNWIYFKNKNNKWELFNCLVENN